MAPNTLYDYYKEKGVGLPSVADRAVAAQLAGVTGYTGTEDQNKTLLGYLNNTPNQGGNNVMTSDNLQPEKPVTVKPPTDTSTGVIGSIASLAETARKKAETQDAEYIKQSEEYAKALKESGNTGAFNEQVIKDQGVDTSKKVRDSFLTQIEQEQKATADSIEELRKNFQGTTGGLNAEINRINRESSTRLANLGIGLSAASRDYETATNIANRLITANTDRIKSDIASRQFVLQQLGTKLATSEANSLQLQLKQIDKQSEAMKDAVKVATDGAKDGSIDANTAFQAVQDFTSGKISISDFYSQLGVTNNDYGNVNGYDITSYATDPQHELKVKSIYDSIPDIKTSENAEMAIKSLSPNSPVTGEMVMKTAEKYKVDAKLLIAIMQQDSSLGTKGMGAKNNNPGNIAQFDDLKQPVEGYKTMQEGVDAVGKWLNANRSSGIYRGEFLSTLETATANLSEASRKNTIKLMKKDIANGDYKSLYKKIENATSSTLTGDNKTSYDAKRVAVPSILDLKDALQAYADAGGDTGLLKGTYEKINNKLGEVNDPKFKTMATDLRIALQKYRKDLSGAAFSEQEAQDYESVNPSGSNKLDLNMSIIDGMYQNFKRQIDTTVDTYAGEGAQYIREYAESGTKPNTQTQEQPWQVTPTGNSFRVISQA